MEPANDPSLGCASYDDVPDSCFCGADPACDRITDPNDGHGERRCSICGSWWPTSVLALRVGRDFIDALLAVARDAIGPRGYCAARVTGGYMMRWSVRADRIGDEGVSVFVQMNHDPASAGDRGVGIVVAKQFFKDPAVLHASAAGVANALGLPIDRWLKENPAPSRRPPIG